MGWGERSCSREKAPKNEFGGCAVAKFETCNVGCKYYTWDGKTRPDSVMYTSTEKEAEKVKQKNRPHPSGLNRRQRRELIKKGGMV